VAKDAPVQDTELDDELDQDEGGSSSPIGDAVERLRSSGAEVADVDDAEDDAETEDAEETAEADEGEEGPAADEEAESEESEGDGKEDEAEGEEETDEESEAGKDAKGAKGFSLRIPPINPKPGDPRSAYELEVQGLTQEFRDVMQGHIKRSQELEGVREQLANAQQKEAIAAFVENEPLAAMHLFAKNDEELRDGERVVPSFVEDWLRMNPQAALKITSKLGLTDAEEIDQERVQERADAARLKRDAAIDKGLGRARGRTAQQQFINEAALVVQHVGREMELDDNDMQDFADLAARRIQRDVEARSQRGLAPRLTRAQMIQLIQPVAQRFTRNGKHADSGKPKAGTRRSPTEEFDRRVRTAERHRRVASGTQQLRTAAPSALKKYKNLSGGIKAAAAELRKER
jgi:hypothetical protein